MVDYDSYEKYTFNFYGTVASHILERSSSLLADSSDFLIFTESEYKYFLTKEDNSG